MSTNYRRTFSVDAEDYGDKYHEHLLEQYKLYVGLLTKSMNGGRNSPVNTYFLSANSFLVTVYGILASYGIIPEQKTWQYFVPAAGLLLCIAWATLIRSYRQLNTGEFKVIHLLDG